MPHKKQKDTEPSEHDQLVERIDAMMDIKRPDEPFKSTAKSANEPIDIFKDLKTSPPIETIEEEAVKEPIPESKPEPVPLAEEIAPEPFAKAGPPILEKSEPTPETPEAPIIIKKPIPVKPAPIKPAKGTTVIKVRDDLDDPETNKAVDEITKNEGDAFFEAQDLAQQSLKPVKKPGFGGKFKKLFR